MTSFPPVKKRTENLLGDGKAFTVGCRIAGGALYPTLSPSACGGSVPQGIELAAYSEGAHRFFICTSDEVYVSVTGIDFIRLEALTGSSPFVIEDISDGTARGIAVRGAHAVYHTGTAFSTLTFDADLCCGAMHCGRVFGVDSSNRRKLCWSGEGGLADWTGGLHGSGYLYADPARGDILDVLEYGDSLVLVRKYGLTIMKVYGAPETFAAKITDTDTDEIYKGTAKVAGGKLLFFTKSGLHAYDGSDITAVGHRFSRDVSAPVCAAAYDGKYFVSCHSDYLNGGAVLCYDTESGESYLIGVAADALCAADCVYAYNGDGAFRLEEGGSYVFCAATDFGDGRRKTVTEIYVGGRADVEISNGAITRKFEGANGIIRPNLRGYKFTVKVTGNAPVHSLTVTAEASVGI